MNSNQTIAQFLKIKDFPFKIKNENGNVIYFENSNGYWIKREYDLNGNVIYFENSKGYWEKREYDSNGKEIYYENSSGTWEKIEYDSNGNIIYHEDSNGFIRDNRPKPVVEMTLQEIADKLGMDVSQIRIKE
jgi:YD repeat-containing protein